MNEILDGIYSAIQQLAQSPSPQETSRGEDGSFRRELSATERRIERAVRSLKPINRKPKAQPAPFLMPVQTPAERAKSVSVLRSALRCRRHKGLSREQREMVGNCGGKGGKPGPCRKLFRASDRDEEPNEAQGGHQAIGAGIYFSEDRESVKGYGKFVKEYEIPDEGLLEVKGDKGLQPFIDDAATWAKGKIAEHLEDVKTGKTKLDPQLLGELATPSTSLRKYLEGKGYKGIRYVKTDKVNDHHDQVLVFRKDHLTSNASPVVVSRLAPYLHDLLGDVTKKQSRVIAQTVKRGIDRKWADSTVARTLARYADLDPERARVVARTEMARARSDVSLGKRPDAAKVVFTLGDEDACPVCRALEGTVRTVRKAQGVIPVHPRCLCSWEDAGKGARVTRNVEIQIAPLPTQPPTPIMDSLLRFSALNQFCPTGAGGGVDPSCSPGKKSVLRSVDLPSPRDQDATDADGGSLLKQEVANDLKISISRIDQAEQGHVSKRRVSRDAEADNEILNTLAASSKFKSDFVGRGLVFDTEQEATSYIDELLKAGHYRTSENAKSKPESFSDDTETARRFATVKSAQVIPGKEQNGHGVLLEVLPKRGDSYRGYRLDYGEGEVILPRGQVYEVAGTSEERSSSGFVLHTVKLKHV